MKPVFNVEPKCRVTMLTREYWLEDLGLLLRLKGCSGLWMGPGLWGGTGLGSMGNL